MMVFKSEDLQPVTTLSNDLSSELNSSYKLTTKITEQLRKIAQVSNIDYDNSSSQLVDNPEKQQQQQQQSQDGSQDKAQEEQEQLARIERTKNENLQLLMDIQREEHLGRKWNRVLEQNQDIFNSLTDWIKMNLENGKIEELESDAASHLLALKQSKEKLKEQVEDSEDRLQFMMQTMIQLQDYIDNEIEKA